MSQLFNFSFQTLEGAPDSPGAGSSNNNQHAKVNIGTTEAPSSIVFSNWQASTTSNFNLIGVMQVSVKFFG